MAIAFRLKCMEVVDRLFHPPFQPANTPYCLDTAYLTTFYWIQSFQQLPTASATTPLQVRKLKLAISNHAVQLHRHGRAPLPSCDVYCICMNGESHVPLLSVLCAAFCASVRISKTKSSIALKPERSILVLLKLVNAFWSSSIASSGET